MTKLVEYLDATLLKAFSVQHQHVRGDNARPSHAKCCQQDLAAWMNPSVRSISDSRS